VGGVEDRGARLRRKMVERLRDDGWLAGRRVEAALLKVPRHVFLPG